jgi:class 3 adenylate cyclase
MSLPGTKLEHSPEVMASILVVDDEAPVRNTTALLLRKCGHHVREADGLVSAIAALDGRAFDLILTDLRMPDGGGLDVLRAARARRPDVPVILLTAYAEWQSAKEAIQLGALDYFEKGAAADELIQRVENALAMLGDASGVTQEPPLAGAMTSADAVRGRRTCLTVLFADLCSSLELVAGQELEFARAVLDAVLERMIDAVHRHGGTVNQVMGDGIMALFGAPVAVDDHALRACAAALAMRDSIGRYAAALRRRRGRDLQVRLGLASGEVIVRSVGSDLHRDYSAVGLTTHIAARLEQAARPGTVLMTAATHARAGVSIRAVSRGRILVKGLLDPVDSYELLGLTQAAATAPSGTLVRETRRRAP